MHPKSSGQSDCTAARWALKQPAWACVSWLQKDQDGDGETQRVDEREPRRASVLILAVALLAPSLSRCHFNPICVRSCSWYRRVSAMLQTRRSALGRCGHASLEFQSAWGDALEGTHHPSDKLNVHPTAS